MSSHSGATRPGQSPPEKGEDQVAANGQASEGHVQGVEGDSDAAGGAGQAHERIDLTHADLRLISAARRGAPLTPELARKLARILMASVSGRRVTVTREASAHEDRAQPPEARSALPWPRPHSPAAPQTTAAVQSIVHARDRREHKRLTTLQAAFAHRGFALDPLTPGTYLLQFRGLTGVLHDLDAAQRFLDELGRAS